MPLHFSKMHGLGNDFAVIDARHVPLALSAAQIRAMAARHTGIGFDQLLSITPATAAGCAFAYGIWNADGEPVGQCGNGVRCVAAWLHRAGVLAVDQAMTLQSPSGPVVVRLVDALTVAVDMGQPRFSPDDIPFQAPAEQAAYPLQLGSETVTIGAVSMGNPHALQVVDDIHADTVTRQGPLISVHPRFAQGCNAGFAQVLDAAHVQLRVHERGSGWTRACGTGACAAAAVLQRQGAVGQAVTVTLPGGDLEIRWQGSGHSLWMTGPAAFVYEGQWPDSR